MVNKLQKTGCLWMAAFFISTALQANPVEQTRSVEQQSQRLAVDVQQRVEQLDAQRQQDFQQWRQLRRENLILQAHNQRTADWNQGLREELDSLQRQLDSLDETRERLDPLLSAMLERLEAFIQHDLPFRQEARLHRVRELRHTLRRADVSHAEKLRQLLATYRAEVEQGRQLSTAQAFLTLDPNKGEERVRLLRVGRIGLYYLSEDQRHAGVWRAQTQTWETLSARERAQVELGLQLADERGLPQMLTLPLSLPLRQQEVEG